MIAMSIVLAISLGVSLFVNYRLFKSMMSVEDQVEQSLDIIDSCYARLHNVSQTPVASDDPMVKEVVSSVVESRDALLLIANKITLNG